VSKKVKKIDLLFREVSDLHAQENFYRIKTYLDNLAANGVAGPQGPPGPPGPASNYAELAAFANALKVTRIANAAINKGDAVYPISATHVDLATANSSKSKATVFGFALGTVLAGAQIDILILGILEDPIFSIFTLNDPLFLDVSGGVTDTKRTTGYHVIVAKSLGGNQIFVNINEPLTLS